VPVPSPQAYVGGHLAVVTLLLDRGAGINDRSASRETPLFCAALHGWSDLVRYLLKRGADPTATIVCGFTPLMAATQRGHAETVRCLLEHPAAAAMVDHRDR
jgi:uncharacterized protein